MVSLATVEAEVTRIVEDRVVEIDSAITTHIQRAQRAIEDRTAFKVQETIAVIEYTTTNETLVLPSDYVAVSDSPFFTPTTTATEVTFLKEVGTFEEIGLRSASSGSPKFWRENFEGFRFYPKSDDLGPSVSVSGAYTIGVPYYKRLATLSISTDSNWWSDNMDDVLAWKAAANVFAELRDPMAQFWNAVAAARFREILRNYNRNKLKSSATSIYPRQSLSGKTRRKYGRVIVSRVPS